MQTPGGPCRGRLGRQEARREAALAPTEARQKTVLGARRPVGRLSWTPGGPSGGRLERQEARREAVLDAGRPVGRPSWAPGGPSGGRLGGQEPRTVGFADSCSENAGFAQAAGRAQAAGWGGLARKVPTASPRR